MKFLRAFTFFFFAFFFIGISGGLFAQNETKNETIPEGIKKITTVEGITEYNLKNGLRVLLFPDQSKPTITVNITYLVGSRHEGYGETGMAHLLEHMVFQGTPKHPNIPQELTEHGTSPNGTTWFDRTNYFETFSATDENLEWALDLESDRMVNSYIAKKDLESEMTVVRNEFEAGENDPSGILMERVISTAYLWHNYGQSTIGARSDIEEVPIERLQAFYKKYYQPDNSVLTVAGKFDVEKMLKLIDKYFSPIPRPDRNKDHIYPTYTKEPTQDGERQVTLKRVGDLQVVSCAYHVPPASHHEYVAIDVLSEVLTSEPSGRLYKAIVEPQMASSVWSWAPGTREASFLYINADVRLEKSLDDAKNTLLTTLDDFVKNPPTDEEVERAKTKLLKYWDLSFNDANRVGRFISEFIAAGDWRLLFIYRDRLEEVTPEDVLAAAKKYLKPSNRTVGLFIPEENPDRAEIPDVPDIEMLVKDYKGKEDIATGEEFDSSPENIEKRTEKLLAKTGPKIALLQKENRGDAVVAKMTFRFGDLKSFIGKAEIADLTSSMLNKGTKKHSRQELQDELDKLGAIIRIYGNLGNVNINIETKHEFLPEVLTLVTEMLKEPTFPQEEFDKLIEEELAYIESQKSEPMALGNIEFQKLIDAYSKDDPRYTQSFDEQIEAIKKVKLEDIKDFYNKFYGASDATISVVGDFDKKEILKIINTELGKWKSPSKFIRIRNEFHDVAAANKEINTPDKANSIFFVGQNLKINRDNPDYPALVLGNFIIGGGFLNSRLATRIRQDEGLSYGVGSWLYANALDESGVFGSYAIYAPENVDKLEKAYNEVIDKVLKEGFTNEEVEAAKSGWLQSQVLNRSNDGRLVSKINENLFTNKDLIWDADFEKKINNLTPEQIHKAIKKYIDPSKFVYVKAGDFVKGRAKNKKP